MFLIVFECVKLRDQKKSLLKKPLIWVYKKSPITYLDVKDVYYISMIWLYYIW